MSIYTAIVGFSLLFIGVSLVVGGIRRGRPTGTRLLAAAVAATVFAMAWAILSSQLGYTRPETGRAILIASLAVGTGIILIAGCWLKPRITKRYREARRHQAE